MATNDGGPAFPTPAGHATKEEWHPGHGEVRKTVAICTTGMSLCDYLAAEAMKSILTHSNPRAWYVDQFDEKAAAVAETAYTIADAMLAERARRDSAPRAGGEGVARG